MNTKRTGLGVALGATGCGLIIYLGVILGLIWVAVKIVKAAWG